MKSLHRAVAGAALFGSMLLLSAATEAQNPPGIPGYLNPATGSFTARANFPAAGAGIAKTGSITVTTTVLIDPALQKVPDQTITCTVNISSFDTVASNTASGSNNVIRAGGKGTCTTTIGFIWEVASTTTKMNITVFVNTGNFGTGQVNHSTGSTTTSIPITTTRFALTLAV
jgi:hypothetical protein